MDFFKLTYSVMSITSLRISAACKQTSHPW
jgi:hypothetical protein